MVATIANLPMCSFLSQSTVTVRRPSVSRNLTALFCIYKLLDYETNCNYRIIMKIVWDEPKRLANLDKHGLDFADLNETFF